MVILAMLTVPASVATSEEGGPQHERQRPAPAIDRRQSRPKWLRLSEGPVGTLRILEHERDARFLMSRKTTSSECLLGAAFALLAAVVSGIHDPFSEARMHRDVVQVTE